VTDDKDRCPTTPAGVKVDAVGCFREFTLRGVEFETNSSELGATGRAELDRAVAEFKRLPADLAAGVKVSIEGHTDSTGTDAYNQGLSERRAASVGRYLVDAGLPASIVSTSGAGESSPVDSNDTVEGRANNRRVVIKAVR
jgi:OOP family OmpA-OmpF porin